MGYEIMRYIGLGIEDEFGTEVPADVHLDVASSGLDTPDGQVMNYEGGLRRGNKTKRPGPYVPSGGMEYAFDVNSIGHLLYLLFGQGTKTDTSAEGPHDWEYEFTPVQNNLILPSATVRVGKDNFEHVFAGGTISELSISIEDEFATVSSEIIAKKDSKDTLKTESELLLPDAYPLAFHETTIEIGPVGGSQTDRSADIESIELSITNNASGEDGVTIGSRFPRRIYAGSLEVTASIDIAFKDTADLEKFWGGADGPADTGPEEQNITLTFDTPDFGNLVINLPRVIFSGISTEPSGRDRLVQSADITAYYDDTAESEIVATLQNNEDYSFLTA